MTEQKISTTAQQSCRRSRDGCWTCRKRKKKCSSKVFPCENCVRLGLQCNRQVKLIWEDDDRRSGMKKRGPLRTKREEHSSDMASRLPSNELSVTSQLEKPNCTATIHTALGRLHRISSWPFELDATESTLLDNYIQRFSATYPTCSGPTNPFLRIILPLSIQSRTVLDAVLALGSVQSWKNGSFVQEKTMLRLRHKALRGCRELASGLTMSSLPQDMSESGSTYDTRVLYLLTTCVLLLLYEKLGGAGQENGTAHLKLFAELLPQKLLAETMMKMDSSKVPESSITQSLNFVANLFLYNDFVRSTSLRQSALCNFYLESTSGYGPIRSFNNYGASNHDRFEFPRLISRMNMGDPTVSEEEITGWNGSLSWLPSFALDPIQATEVLERLPLSDAGFIVNENFHQLSTFQLSESWDERNIISELYRVAALIYRRQCLVQSALVPQGPLSPSIFVPSDITIMGNLPSWGAQLVGLLPHGSQFENTLLWPIGIFARELTAMHQTERHCILGRLQSLENKFQIKHFARVRCHLTQSWTASDAGQVYDNKEELLFG